MYAISIRCGTNCPARPLCVAPCADNRAIYRWERERRKSTAYCSAAGSPCRLLPAGHGPGSIMGMGFCFVNAAVACSIWCGSGRWELTCCPMQSGKRNQEHRQNRSQLLAGHSFDDFVAFNNRHAEQEKMPVKIFLTKYRIMSTFAAIQTLSVRPIEQGDRTTKTTGTIGTVNYLAYAKQRMFVFACVKS